MYMIPLENNNASNVNSVIKCVYGIVYKMLNTLFQICSLTEAILPLDENKFELFYCNSSMNIWTSTFTFCSSGTRTHALFNHSR